MSPLLDFLCLGLLELVEEEEVDVQVPGMKLQCIKECVGNESYFPYRGYKTLKFNLHQNGSAVLLEHGSLFL